MRSSLFFVCLLGIFGLARGSGGTAHDTSYYSVLYAFGVLALGFTSNALLSRYLPNLPYTVFMLLVGAVIGLIHRGTHSGLGVLSSSIESWDTIDPHLLMYSFIPALLFGDAMNLNWHHVKRCFFQCLLLAGPGVVLGTVLTALVAKYVFPYSWSWELAFCFGSITAATDPVAVVGLLNSLGASKKLTMVIAGESLMNDGVAIVVFTLFKNMLTGTTYTAGSVIEFLFQVSLGGPAVGLAFAMVGLWILLKLKLSNEDNPHQALTNQSILTFVLAYLSFFVGEAVCEVSGVLACVVSGVLIAAYGWPLITSRDALQHVWHVGEFMGNTIVFTLSGTIIATDIYDSFAADSTKTWEYFGYMLVLYFFMVIIRAVMMIMLFPALSRLGYGFERGWKDAFIGVWGGLRGAIGLILCLLVDQDTNIHKSESFLILIGGATALTLIVNGTTTKFFLEKLGLLKEQCAAAMLGHQAAILIHKKVKCRFRVLADKDLHPEYHSADVEAAHSLLSILGDSWKTAKRLYAKSDEHEAEKKLGLGVSSMTDAEAGLASALTNAPTTDESYNRTFRVVYLGMVQAEYDEMVRSQIIPVTSSIPSALHASIELALDEVDSGLTDWFTLELSLRTPWYHKCAMCSKVMKRFGRVAPSERGLYLVTSYVNAHRRAMANFESMLATIRKRLTKSSHGDDRKALCQTLTNSAFEALASSHGANMTLARQKLEALEVDIKSTSIVLQTKLLAAESLKSMHHELERLKQNGMLFGKTADTLEDMLYENYHLIQTANCEDILSGVVEDPRCSRTRFGSVEIDQATDHKNCQVDQTSPTVDEVEANIEANNPIANRAQIQL